MTKKTDPAGLKLRLAAAQRLKSVLGGDHFAPLSAHDMPDGRDRALANRLVTTALRRQGQINAMIAELLEKGLPPRSGSFEAVLRLSLAQLVFLPDLGAHSALFLAVEAIRRDPKARHLTGLMNAVLRKAQSNSARYGLMDESLLLPAEVAQAWQDQYGADAIAAFEQALISGAPLDLTLRDNDPDLIEALGATPLIADSVRLESRDRPVEALPGYDAGRFWVQDAASALPARLLNLSKGAEVLDLCAAPGGKTAQLLKAGYVVTALDADAARLERLRANMDRLGYQPTVIEADAATFGPTKPFDGVLLDAPCSATGTFRRHPEVLWQRSARGIAERVRLQQALLANAYRCLAPGGTLIYAVCSLEPDEGEHMAEWALGALPELALMPIVADELPGLEAAITPAGTLRCHPGLAPHGIDGGMDGFFVARFQRTR
ncbi:MAG: RsmB/NOP family class I SAM-dependent RNA methyltransferase [Devosia sp.]|uniref:RsmB/NOP family class I SAM-dependent RNA methyltransferase n=1 Tax=Devosia sp. TaxID=1871048 RepID=UPI0024CC68E4|nr:RsmB/NOP family class I SAM-dependent RNA methyltransferase [Devosia sp.]UYN98744.1 MAG: RsmB/NOP family class I SAM-dependent RNA methyltransferase [Devosia sp.]